jgi:hypothetical protein
MKSSKTELIELIEQVDLILVDRAPIFSELIPWLPSSTIESFIEDAKSALEMD